MITANTVFNTCKAGTWELLINYFTQHYGNEHTAADNPMMPSSLPVVTSLILVRLICWFDSGGSLLVLETGASDTWLRLICKVVFTSTAL